jgi:hypothetical protein
MTIDSDVQTISSLSFIKGLTLCADKGIYGVSGRSSSMGLGGIDEVGEC